jgi:uncharacterized membrane protein
MIVKTLTYRVISILADIAVVYALTRDAGLALAFGTLMVVISTIIYFVHERVWAGILWGKNGFG